MRKPDAPQGQEITVLTDAGNLACGEYQRCRFRRHIKLGDWTIAVRSIAGWIEGCKSDSGGGHSHD